MSIVNDNNSRMRIKHWIKANIHMIWRELGHVQGIGGENIGVKITFYEGSYPIVLQSNCSSGLMYQPPNGY